MDTEYLPLNRAALHLGVTRMKLSQLAKKGALPYTTTAFDRRVKLFRVADLDAFIQNNRKLPVTW